MIRTIVTISNVDTNEYFFTTDHCQQSYSKVSLSSKWVPRTTYLPYTIAARKGFENGVIDSKEEFIRFQSMYDGKEIPNPDPIYQA